MKLVLSLVILSAMGLSLAAGACANVGSTAVEERAVMETVNVYTGGDISGEYATATFALG